MNGGADAVRRGGRARERPRLVAEDLRQRSLVKVRGDPDDFGSRLHEGVRGLFERGEVRARAIDHERDEDAGRPGVLRLPQVDRTERAAAGRVEPVEGGKAWRPRPDERSDRVRDARQGGREDAAHGDVDDVMAATLCEEPYRAVRRDDELRARPVADDGVRAGDRPDRDGKRGVPGDGSRDAPPLEHELLVVREVERRAAAAAVGVIAVDSLG